MKVSRIRRLGTVNVYTKFNAILIIAKRIFLPGPKRWANKQTVPRHS